MATAKPTKRPISPHLSAYRWGPAMLVSILHRATGSGMATVGAILLVWWLAVLAAGEASYAAFLGWFTVADGSLNLLGYVVCVGLSLSLFQHIGSGLRHLFLDTGAGYELKRNKRSAILTMLFSVLATVVFWAYLTIGK